MLSPGQNYSVTYEYPHDGGTVCIVTFHDPRAKQVAFRTWPPNADAGRPDQWGMSWIIGGDGERNDIIGDTHEELWIYAQALVDGASKSIVEIQDREQYRNKVLGGYALLALFAISAGATILSILGVI